MTLTLKGETAGRAAFPQQRDSPWQCLPTQLSHSAITCQPFQGHRLAIDPKNSVFLTVSDTSE